MSQSKVGKGWSAMVSEMAKKQYILVDGKPVPEPDISAWGKWMDDNDRRIARTLIQDQAVGDIQVSTVFLGYASGWLGWDTEGPPALFETLVFNGPLDMDGERYHTAQEAKEGHEKWVRRVDEALDGK